MGSELPRGMNLDRVIAAKRELESHNTSEEAALSSVRYGSVVVLEFLGDHPQTKRIQLVEDKKGLEVEGVDMLVDVKTPVGQKIFGQVLDGTEISVKEGVRIRILEIIDSEPPKTSEPQPRL